MNDDMQGALPPGWVWTTIGSIAVVNPGKSRIRGLSDDTDVTFVPMSSVDEVKGIIADPQDTKLREVRKGYTIFTDGDVIFAKITPCMENGKAAIVRNMQNGLGFGSTEFHVIQPKDSVLPEWIYHYVRQAEYRRLAKASFTGTAGQLRVSRVFVELSSIPLSPLNEQRRIVAKLEELLTRLDAGVAALKHAQANLKRYKASVLKAACEGKLVPTEAELARAEGRTYEPADELLKRILAERRAKWEADLRPKGKDPSKAKYVEPQPPDTSGLPELPEGWCWSIIDHVTECLDYKRIPINRKERENRIGNIPYYGANGQVGWINDFIFDEDLILVVEDETFTGREKSFAYKITGRSWVNNHAHVLRPTDGVSVDYLNYSLAYYPFTPLTTGTTGRRKLTQAALMLAPYALPPQAEQRRIVAEIERRLSVVTKIEITININLARAERLRQSILRRAFSGKLVPQDSTDEPASMTLSRLPKMIR